MLLLHFLCLNIFRKSHVYKPTSLSASVYRNSGNATAGWLSPPTRLSPGGKNKGHTANNNRRPLHSKTEAGEIAKKLQEEFDREDHMITLIPKCSSRKPWVEKSR